MRRRQPPPGHEATPFTIRLAWWVAFFATLALVFGLAQIQSASAASPALAAPGTLLFAEAEEEAEASEEPETEWEAEEECEIFGEGEEAEEFCEEVETEGETPPKCLLNSAEATVSILPGRDLLRLTVRYTARAPAAVKVAIRARGGKGALDLGEDQRRFGRKGTFRDAAQLSEAELEKALAARSFTVALQAVNTPSSCHRHLDRKLTAKRALGGELTWEEPPARAAARASR